MAPAAAAAAAAIGSVMENATDRFHVIDFQHVEFWCADAASAAARFSFGLGVPLAAQSDLSTGNAAHASRLLRSRSGSLSLLFTAPYAPHVADSATTASLPSFKADAARRFTGTHGLAVRAVSVRVADAAEAFAASVDAGARPAFAPTDLGHGFGFAEVELAGDSVLRFVSYPDGSEVSFLPGFQDVASSAGAPDFGLTRFDHVDVNIPELAPVVANVAGFTGFHKFWEFTADEVCPAESGVNGLVLANNSENVLLSILEPMLGTKLRSHVETFLHHHGGPGIQHLAMTGGDILGTLREIQARSSMGGFELLPPPPASYYDGVRQRAGDVLSEKQIKECQELGVRVDRGYDDGVVLQAFTKPAVDR
jgi:4-hydroxyphenylpyruvate dioxygenase